MSLPLAAPKMRFACDRRGIRAVSIAGCVVALPAASRDARDVPVPMLPGSRVVVPGLTPGVYLASIRIGARIHQERIAIP